MEENETKKTCFFCDKSLAIFGIVLGVAFLFMSIDVLTGSALSSMISGGKADTDE